MLDDDVSRIDLLDEPHGDDEATEHQKISERRRATKSRTSRSVGRRNALSADLVERLAPLLMDARVIAAYVPYESEPDCLPLMTRLREAGVRVLVPKLGPGLSRDWAWFEDVDDLAERAPGRPAEPSGEALGADALAEADAVLVPALGVDRAGYRLGRGGGWYDRALLHVRPGTPIYALLFDEDVVEDHMLPRGKHDVPVTHVATPTRLLEAQGAAGRD